MSDTVPPYTPDLEDVSSAWRAGSDGQPDTHPEKPTWSEEEFARFLEARDFRVSIALLDSLSEKYKAAAGGVDDVIARISLTVASDLLTEEAVAFSKAFHNDR